MDMITTLTATTGLKTVRMVCAVVFKSVPLVLDNDLSTAPGKSTAGKPFLALATKVGKFEAVETSFELPLESAQNETLPPLARDSEFPLNHAFKLEAETVRGANNFTL